MATADTTAGDTGLAPTAPASRLGEQMLAAEQVMEEILDETIQGTERGVMRESGRTVCGDTSDIRSPAARFPTSVELRQCPRDATGLWHTHVTQEQLRNPEHSLPDMANVVMAGVDVSVVVGTESAEIMYSGEPRQQMLTAYRRGLGIDVQQPREVVDALKTGQIRNPPRRRQELRSELSPLFARVNTGYTDLQSRLATASAPQPSMACLEPLDGVAMAVSGPDAGGLRELSRDLRPFNRISTLTGDLDIKREVASTSIGVLAGNLVNSVVIDSLLGM